MSSLATLNPTAIAGILAAAAALVGAVTAFLKFGLGERGTLTITQAQGANTILDASLKTLERQLERRDAEIVELEADIFRLTGENRTLRTELERHGLTDPTAP